MNQFRKTAVCSALAAVSGVVGVQGAQAVTLNPDGLGQALIYPYYSVRTNATNGTFQSLLSIANSTTSAKAVKVRFLEGRLSKEVLDFNLFLSANDMWTAAVIPSGAGAGIVTSDTSCTVPRISNSAANPTNFVNFAYIGDPGDQTLDRTKEGYIEVIEMGTIQAPSVTSNAITHRTVGANAGTPPCNDNRNGGPGANAQYDLLVSPDQVNPPVQVATDIRNPNGGLFGGITLLNAVAGEDISVEATALDAFRNSSFLTSESSILPTLANASPRISVVTTGSRTLVTNWDPTVGTGIPGAGVGGANAANTADAVSAVLMHSRVLNEYVLDTATASGTDWVITAPTKRFYYAGVTGTQQQVLRLFQRNFTNAGGGTACDDVSTQRFDREEQTLINSTGFSPPAPGTASDALCYEATVLTFNNSNLLASVNSNNISVPFQNGWAALNINPVATTLYPAAQPTNLAHVLAGGQSIVFDSNVGTTSNLAVTTYIGLPTIGFAVATFRNNSQPDSTGATVRALYAGRQNHRFERNVQ